MAAGCSSSAALRHSSRALFRSWSAPSPLKYIMPSMYRAFPRWVPGRASPYSNHSLAAPASRLTPVPYRNMAPITVSPEYPEPVSATESHQERTSSGWAQPFCNPSAYRAATSLSVFTCSLSFPFSRAALAEAASRRSRQAAASPFSSAGSSRFPEGAACFSPAAGLRSHPHHRREAEAATHKTAIFFIMRITIGQPHGAAKKRNDGNAAAVPAWGRTTCLLPPRKRDFLF